jgi:hypothetical protein
MTFAFLEVTLESDATPTDEEIATGSASISKKIVLLRDEGAVN